MCINFFFHVYYIPYCATLKAEGGKKGEEGKGEKVRMQALRIKVTFFGNFAERIPFPPEGHRDIPLEYSVLKVLRKSGKDSLRTSLAACLL
jgi:hypothetical protein